MKKVLFLLVAFMLVLTGCTSTNPSLKDVWLNAMNQTSSEGKVTFSADVNIDGMNLGVEEKKIAQLLETGFVIEQKAQDEHNAYMKITPINDQPLRDLGYWTAKEKAEAEMVIKNDVMYVRTSADPHYYMIDMNEMNEMNGLGAGPSQYEMQQQVMEFMKGSFGDYVSQFNYEIPKLENLGLETLETPEGKEEVLKVKMEIGINEALDFVVYTLDNLANYEKLDEIIKELASFAPAEVQPTGAEIETAVAEAKTQMTQFKAMLSGMTEESLEDLAGLDVDFKVETEVGISKKKYIASEDTVINISIKERDTGEKGSAVIKAKSLVWNVNGDIQLPEVTNVVNVSDYASDINKVKTLPDDSPIKKLLMKEFNATFTIGQPFAMLGTSFEVLDAPPYTKDGSTMVPVGAVGKWLESEAKWDAKTQQVTLEANNTKIQLTLGSKIAYVNGKQVTMNTAAETKNGRTFVPVAFIANELGAQASYDSQTQQVKIYFE